MRCLGWACAQLLIIQVGCGNPSGPSLGAQRSLQNALAPFNGTCTFNSLSGGMVVAFPPGGDLAVLVRRPADGVILLNDAPCPSSATVPVNATSTNVHILTVTGDTGDDTLILDFGGGTFGLGHVATPGTVVDLGAGSNAFKLRGTANADSLTLGTLGISLSAGNRDLSVATSSLTEPSFEFALGDGNDTVSTAGSAVTGAAWLNDTTVFGGNGNDTFLEGVRQNGNTIFNGGQGVDTVSYALRTAALSVSVDDTANDGDPSGAGEWDNIMGDVEVVMTGSGADTLSSGANPVTLNGGAGDDTFDEGTVATPGTVMVGGAGFDTVTYANRVSSHSIHVTVGALANDGDFVSGELDDIHADVEHVVGGPGDDVLTGGPGNDTLCGGPGNDILSGGAGDDTFEAGNDPGGDTYRGGAGVDTVDYTGRIANLWVDMVGTLAAPDADDGALNEHDDVGDDVENCKGGDGDDTLTGNALDNELSGGPGNDTLSGGAGNDTLEGGSANGPQVFNCGTGDDIAISTDPNDAVGTDCEL